METKSSGCPRAGWASLEHMDLLPIFLLVFLVFVNRYVVGRLLQRLRPEAFDGPRSDAKPTVAIVIPLYNEGQGIYRTVESLLQQDYPNLSIVVVDDASTDDSWQWARRAAEGRPNVHVLRNAENMGKRLSIARAVRMADAEIIVSVDSDVVAEPDAVSRLVERFTSPEIAAVGGRVLVSNARENWLTAMQAVKYHFGYLWLKSIERAYQSVLCLSGCLTAYRRHVLLELEPVLLRRNLLGVPIKYGEDRFLSRQILRAGYRTTLTLDARCYTIAPPSLAGYMSQQLRWRRSNLVDMLGGLTHVWRLHPVVALHYFSVYALLLAYPVLVARQIVHGHFAELTVEHAAVLVVLGLVYRRESRSEPDHLRVPALAILPLALIMPLTYVLLTPLALFTLDSGSWETRVAAAAEPVAQPEPGAEVAST